MRKNALAIVISSVLLSAAAVGQTEPTSSSPSSPTSQNDTSVSGTTTTTPDANTATGTSTTGSMDADQGTSSSTSTTSTDASATAPTSDASNASDQALISTHHWTQADVDGDGQLTLAEVQAVAPSLATSYQDMDSDGNGKLSRDELKAYQTAHPGTSMEADQGTSPQSSPARPTRRARAALRPPTTTRPVSDPAGVTTLAP